MFLGLRSAIYHAPDLDAAKRWYVRALGIEPYFDEPFYVGFELGAKPVSAVADVGGDIKVGVVEDPFGNALGIIQNPHFKPRG